MSTQPIDWSEVLHAVLVSNLEDNTGVAKVKVGEKKRREEEAKAEHHRHKEVSSKHIACCRDTDDGWHRCEK